MKEIALHILDIAENGVAAGAGRICIEVYQSMVEDSLQVRVEDDGRGMDEVELELAADPFYTSRSTRKVGLGLPLFRQHAEMTGGKFEIGSQAGKGTKVEASFLADHPDRQPLGDLEGCWTLLVNAHQDIDWELELGSERGNFAISTGEIKTALELDVIKGVELTEDLKRLIRNKIDELGIS